MDEFVPKLLKRPQRPGGEVVSSGKLSIQPLEFCLFSKFQTKKKNRAYIFGC